ncbi:MAG: adenylyltransferase/cytidyltransferase family protein [Thermotogae bacterium]|nr:adenylyltransferase/cytidyltransferase family protein [Thermotogota bacterium]
MELLTLEDVYPHPTCAAVGSFDGLHRAHRYILSRCRTLGGNLLVVTFLPHPTRLKDLLFTPEEKLEALEEMGVEVVLTLRAEDKRLSAEEFMRVLQSHFQVKVLLMGYDHHFGRGRAGSPRWLLENYDQFPIELHVFPPMRYRGKVISSSLIRELLKEGRVEEANELLGYRYILSGKVIKGKGLGGKLGFPTANLSIPSLKLLPSDGVYAVYVQQVRRYGVLHVGPRPTLGLQRSVEVHILNFGGEIPERLKVSLVARLRDVKKFASVEDLRLQIERDIKLTNILFSDGLPPIEETSGRLQSAQRSL